MGDGSTPSSIWRGLRQQLDVGDPRFMAPMHAHSKEEGPLDARPQGQRQVARTSVPDLASEHADRRPALAAASWSGGYTMKTIGAYFGVQYSPVSRAVREAERNKATE